MQWLRHNYDVDFDLNIDIHFDINEQLHFYVDVNDYAGTPGCRQRWFD